MKAADKSKTVDKPKNNPEEHVDKCLSMVLHHEEVQKMAVIIKEVLKQNSGNGK